MIHHKPLNPLGVLILTFAVHCGIHLQAAEVRHLRCEYLTNPLGIDAEKPRLNWVIEESRPDSEARGIKQTAYQILVASSEAYLKKDKGDLWDSGKVASDQQNQIAYAGKPLSSKMRCHWKVRVWTDAGLRGSWFTVHGSEWSRSAYWTIGLLKPADWQAKWIGLEHVIPEDAFDHEITEGKLVIKKAIYSADDKAKAVDLAEKLNGMIDKGTLGATLTTNALGVDPGRGRQHLAVEYEYNGKPCILETPTANRLGDIYLPSGTMYLDTPEGLKERKRWAIPRQLRKEFNAAKNIRHAALTVTALGLYEFRINGKRVGDHLLAPEWTDYNKHVQYQTYDVSGMVKSGKNAMGAILGNGWYCGGWMFWGKTLRSIYGKDPSLLAQLDVEYEDGSKDVVATDASWRGTTEGPVRFAGIYEGEIYDARREMPGWDSPGFDDSKWSPAVVRVQKEKPDKLDFQVEKLVAQRSEPIRKEMEIKPVAITEPRPGVYVADMGQIFSGWTRLKIDAPAGTKLTLQHNEALNPDGTVYTDNLRAGHFGKGDRQVDRYFCRGDGEEIFEPHFTYHGFRYVQINGLPKKPTVDEVAGIVFHTGFRKTGEFTCSNPLLTRLVENIQWSQRANVMGIPTDCNQRDERCGYTGDMNFFMPAAVYNFDMAPFFNKWLVDVAGAQMPEGWFADHAPYYGPGGGPNVGWSDAGILCPFRMYREYGDTKVIKEHYASMKRAMDQLISTTDSDGTRGGQDKKGRGWRIGHTDHASAGSVKPNAVIVGTAYLAANAQAMAEMARAIGENTDAAMYDELAKKTATAFSEKLIDANGRVQFGETGPKNQDTQCGYALAFSMGLVPDHKKALVSERFNDRVKQDKGQITTGFMGNPCILQALGLAGREDIAYKLLLNERYPSWLYPVTVGATTIWEHFGSYRPEAGGLADPWMNSLSHYAHGAVGGFIFGHVGGIRPETPGYKRMIIQPVIRPGLAWAKTSYDSIQGRIATAWRVGDGKLDLEVTIPVNATATVYVPAAEGSAVMENGRPAEQSDAVRLLRSEKDKRVFEVGSGSYHFLSVLPSMLAATAK
ncbi:MAG: glycoside hydrolase family 78 protein [bacterium]